MHERSVQLIVIALGSASLVVGLGVAVLALVVRLSRDAHWVDRDYRGTLGRVATPIPINGVGTLVHRRFGVRSTIPARHLFGAALGAGDDAVIVDVEDGVALVTPFKQ